ncbi:hypothetical protein [Croceicoccus sp. Ery15]|uniref:DUF6946 family protein n=1 Tax=Croceicoccus sp. Ery15 TaxID=1703338 RepID=UPI001E471C9F|nr:hypothetical protein [Croceicoccus sp. Ery15]
MPFYVPTEGADAWRKFLAEPDKQWRDGYSAKSLAECWEDARGIPTEVGALLETIAPAPRLLFALPEHKVALPGSSRGESQNDIFAFVRAGPSTVAVMIEGKVDESFDRQLTDWLRNASPGKIERLSYLASSLGLDAASIPGTIHYQLLHRTVSALIEADRYKADAAAMIVHSFSPTRKWFDAFAAFCWLLGIEAEPGRLYLAKTQTSKPLYLGWASGKPARPI